MSLNIFKKLTVLSTLTWLSLLPLQIFMHITTVSEAKPILTFLRRLRILLLYLSLRLGVV